MTSPAVPHPQLQQLLRELDEASARARRLVESYDDRAFGAKSSATSWSAAEAVAHLTLTGRNMIAAIDRALASGAQTAVPDDHRYRMDLMGAALRWTLEPPYRIKMPTTPPFVPKGVATRQAVLAEFLEQQHAVADRIARANGRDLMRVKVASPFNEKVHYNVYAAFRILITHERRHLWQAEQTLARQAR